MTIIYLIFYMYKQRAFATIGIFLAICIGVKHAIAYFRRYQNNFISVVPFRPHNQQIKIGKIHFGLTPWIVKLYLMIYYSKAYLA